MTTVADVLRGALADLRTHGWIQKEFGDVEHGMCSLGAIDAQRPPWSVLADAYQALGDAVGATVVSHWNDAPERTFEEVEAAFLRAIDIANE